MFGGKLALQEIMQEMAFRWSGQKEISEVFKVFLLKVDHQKIMKKLLFGHSLKTRTYGTVPVR